MARCQDVKTNQLCVLCSFSTSLSSTLVYLVYLHALLPVPLPAVSSNANNIKSKTCCGHTALYIMYFSFELSVFCIFLNGFAVGEVTLNACQRSLKTHICELFILKKTNPNLLRKVSVILSAIFLKLIFPERLRSRLDNCPTAHLSPAPVLQIIYIYTVYISILIIFDHPLSMALVQISILTEDSHIAEASNANCGSPVHSNQTPTDRLGV